MASAYVMLVWPYSVAFALCTALNNQKILRPTTHTALETNRIPLTQQHVSAEVSNVYTHDCITALYTLTQNCDYKIQYTVKDM